MVRVTNNFINTQREIRKIIYTHFLALGIFFIFFCSFANGESSISFSCHWERNGENSLGKNEWEDFRGELLIGVEQDKLNMESRESDPLYPSIEAKYFTNEVNEQGDLQRVYRYMRSGNLGRLFIFIPQNLLNREVKASEILIQLNNPLKRWSNVYINCKAVE